MAQSRERVSFPGFNGEDLQGVIEFPLNRKPHAYAIFAHCFTCGKNVSAARRIAQSVAQAGIATLRFDFTGLGDSEGEFAATNFSSNLKDIEAAHAFMSENFAPPTLLIGHSLGGSAVLASGLNISGIEAIVTVGAPSDPVHVKKLFKGSLEQIEKEGSGEVVIGYRKFVIQDQFIKDIQQTRFLDKLKNMRKPLLIMHSPQDKIVGIENAAEIYKAAFHPKSFVTLDGSDHMLSDAKDAQYAGELIGTWIRKYIPEPELTPLDTDHQVIANLSSEKFTTLVRAGRHHLTADEPEDIGGNDFGPTPYELLGSALATCTVMTLKMYALRKGIDLKEVNVHVSHEKKHGTDSDAASATNKIDEFTRDIELFGDLTEAEQKRLLEIADKCPVHRTLENPNIQIKTSLL